MKIPKCECGNTVFTLEKRESPVEIEYVDAKTYWEQSVWTTYTEAYQAQVCEVAACSLCKRTYLI